MRGATATALHDADSLSSLLRPILRAYVLGYASSVSPRLLSLLAQHVPRRKRKDVSYREQKTTSFADQLWAILKRGLDSQRFPTFCALTVGGGTLFEVVLRRILARLQSHMPLLLRLRLSRFLSTFLSALLSYRLLQSKDSSFFVDSVPPTDLAPGAPARRVRYGGRTLDLTLFAVTRAADVVVGELWSRRRLRRTRQGKWTKTEDLVGRFADPVVFVASCSLIMWSWFYNPSRLPISYSKWIASAAAVDNRLIEALRRCRTGEILYGKDTGQAHLLESMCADCKLPVAWGNPEKAIPFPCELYHMESGPSCEWHAVSRFYRSWFWAMAMYGPLSLALLARQPNSKGLRKAIISASRSSAFLGAFIALFYYGVCLVRTRVGPHVLGTDTETRQRIDGGLCVGAGCALCGWSVLIEAKGRQKDMSLFVAPRALGTLFPRRYALEKQWRETLAFAASTAIVFTCVQENPKRVRGMLGTILSKVLER